MIAAAQPTMNAGNRETYPATGVMVASPAIVPVATPSAVGFPRCAHSISIHTTVAVEAAIWGATQAPTACAFAPNELPALDPNQPHQSRTAPTTVRGRLSGGIGVFG